MRKELSVVLCINRRYGPKTPSCAASGAEELAVQLEQKLEDAGLNIPLQRIKCLGQCELGPNLRIAPGGRFFHHLTLDDLPGVVRELQRLVGEQ